MGRMRMFPLLGVPMGGRDTLPPTVVITSNAVEPVSAAFTATLTFSEAVVGFVVGDITAVNCALSDFATADNITFTATVNPTLAVGSITLDIAEGVCTDNAGNANTAAVQLVVTQTLYDWLDEYAVVLAADNVHGTLSTWGNKTRTVVDTQHKLSTNGAAAVFAGPASPAAYGDPGLWYNSELRALGKVMVARIVIPTAAAVFVGWDINQSAVPGGQAFQFGSNYIAQYDNGGGGQVIGTYTANVPYDLTLVLRAIGADYFIKGGTEYPQTTLLWRAAVGLIGTLYPCFINYTSAAELLYLGVPTTRWMMTPLASDGFGGAWGSTDGKGHAEGIAVAALGTGGNGLAWTNQVGTFGITSSKAQASELTGGVAIATVDTSNPNVLFDLTVTRADGIAGAVLRYVDANNYLYAGHDGTNAVLVEVAGGTPSTIITGIPAIGGGLLRVKLSGTHAELYWNAVRVGTGGTISAGTSGKHGLYTTNVGNTHDALAVYALGA